MPLKLSVTSAAILGQLALRPWTTYELATEMRRNFRYFWPRAESQIYAEIKTLADKGLATAKRTFVGKRGRTTYTITKAGKAALAQWLDTPPKSASMEFEGLLRIFFGPLGNDEQALLALDRILGEAHDLVSHEKQIQGEYQAGSAPIQEHIHYRVFIWDFLRRYADMVAEWAEETRDEIEARSGLPIQKQQLRAMALFDSVKPSKA